MLYLLAFILLPWWGYPRCHWTRRFWLFGIVVLTVLLFFIPPHGDGVLQQDEFICSI